jgi:hypothetical protein
MAISVMNEDVQDAQWQVRLHSIWFAAHAAHARTLLLVEKLCAAAGDDVPGNPDDFKAGIFTSEEARIYLADAEMNRVVLANALAKKRADLEEAAPRKAGRPKGSKNKGEV